jgi:peroxiredoxin
MTWSKPTTAARQEFGRPVPGFKLPEVGGSGAHTLQDYIAGKMGALLVFWSAVCAHCRRYDTYFNSFPREHMQLGFVAIASRHGETRGLIEAAVQQRDLRFPILLDQSGEVARRWHAQQTPRCYLVDSQARLVYRGAVDNFKLPPDPDYVAYLEPAIHSYLGGKAVARAETASFGCAIETTYYHLPKQL